MDSRTNGLRVRDAEGKTRMIDPAARGQSMKTYDPEARQIAVGDRMRITENGSLQNERGEAVKVRNGQVVTVQRIDGDRLTLRIGGDGDKAVRVVADARGLNADHDYAVTSYSAQGRTVDKVMIHHNTEAGAHNSREGYVNVTRARQDALIYTQDPARMEKQVGIEQSKSAAHDIVPTATREQAAEHKPEPTVEPSRDAGRGREYGIER